MGRKAMKSFVVYRTGTGVINAEKIGDLPSGDYLLTGGNGVASIEDAQNVVREDDIVSTVMRMVDMHTPEMIILSDGGIR